MLRRYIDEGDDGDRSGADEALGDALPISDNVVVTGTREWFAARREAPEGGRGCALSTTTNQFGTQIRVGRSVAEMEHADRVTRESSQCVIRFGER